MGNSQRSISSLCLACIAGPSRTRWLWHGVIASPRKPMVPPWDTPLIYRKAKGQNNAKYWWMNNMSGLAFEALGVSAIDAFAVSCQRCFSRALSDFLVCGFWCNCGCFFLFCFCFCFCSCFCFVFVFPFFFFPLYWIRQLASLKPPGRNRMGHLIGGKLPDFREYI